MFLWSAILFALAALGGLTLAVLHFRGHGRERPPTPLAIGHGLIAAVALVLLILGVIGAPAGTSSLPVVALAIFVLAALGGAYLFLGRHLRGQPLPSAVVVVHGLAAVAGFLVLLAFLLLRSA